MVEAQPTITDLVNRLSADTSLWPQGMTSDVMYAFMALAINLFIWSIERDLDTEEVYQRVVRVIKAWN